MTDVKVKLINCAEELVGRDFDHYDNRGVHFTDGKFITYQELENLTEIYKTMNLDN